MPTVLIVKVKLVVIGKAKQPIDVSKMLSPYLLNMKSGIIKLFSKKKIAFGKLFSSSQYLKF